MLYLLFGVGYQFVGEVVITCNTKLGGVGDGCAEKNQKVN
jgi:hypothetical protein